jgi:hypothetical protein
MERDRQEELARDEERLNGRSSPPES